MSRTLLTNSGSLDSLKVSTRCGCRPKAPQMRCTVVTETPVARAIERRLQWVAFSGTVSSVRVTTSAILSSPILARCAGPRLVVEPLKTPLGKAGSPEADGPPRDAQLPRNRRVA